jgi:UDP-N-acetylglucosamine 4,6-dehydratase/5-epimerase
MFYEKNILVTGGSGSWGHELVRQLLPHNPNKIIIFSRNEGSQVEMERTFEDNRLSFCIGDIRDKESLERACKGVDFVFHLAALKHVPICEEQPHEALKTNVAGTQNVIEAAIANKVKKVIYISTDKAVNPTNFYGMTKAVGEKLIVQANLLDSNTKFVCIRGGNVLGTNGSVIHLFMKQIKEKNQVGLTSKAMTRFFLTLHEAISLVFKVCVDSLGGEIFVMMMPACKIIDLAQALAEELGHKHITITELGVRPGEKIHEILLSDFESESAVIYDQQYLVIMPTLDIPGLKAHYADYPKVQMRSFSSQHALMTKEEIKVLLAKGGFLS